MPESDQQLTSNIIGLFPAAGFGRRLGPRQHSKELVQVPDMHASVSPGGARPTIAVGDYLVRQYLEADIRQLLIIRREPKSDIPEHFRSLVDKGLMPTLDIIDHITGPTPSTCHSIDSAWSLIKGHTVAMGFPDMLIQPPGIFSLLLKQLNATGSDICLALFPAQDPQRWDMVSFSPESGLVTNIALKPSQSRLRRSWACAIWRPQFSALLHALLLEQSDRKPVLAGQQPTLSDHGVDGGEFYVGVAIQAAIEHQLKVSAVDFPQGRVIDIGTPKELERVLNL